jgi:hypothetical protein
VGEDAIVPVDMERLHIGRSQRCALVLDDPTVSKVIQAALVESDGERLTLERARASNASL